MEERLSEEQKVDGSRPSGHIMKKPMINMMKKERFDDLFTPFDAVHTLCRHIIPCGIIWECCDPGTSNITHVLKEMGYKVIGTDIKTGFDFLTDNPDFDFDMIITNPPYSLKDKFIERCYYYRVPFALLLPTTSLESANRGRMFREYGISMVVPDRRFNFTPKRSPWFHTSWFVGGVFRYNTIIFDSNELSE